MGGKRLRVEVLLSAALALEPPPAPAPVPAAPMAEAPPPTGSPPPPFDWRALVDPDLWDQVPADLDALLAWLPHADLYVQDEADVKFHPTLTRLWSRRGRAGQRRVRAPGTNRKVVAYAALDWREGWGSFGYSLTRNAATFARQLDHLVARSRARGRRALVLTDNARIHTPAGAKVVREALQRHGAWLRLVYTPPYDPEANPTERFWLPLRRAITHNHHRDAMLDLYHDLLAYGDALDANPACVLRHIGSPSACDDPLTTRQAA